MEKPKQPAWAGGMRKLLEKVKCKDKNLEISGAHSHKYKLRAPADEAKIRKFEADHQIELPEEYRKFLLFLGDGGAGPYFGLYSLKEVDREVRKGRYRLEGEPVICPEMSEEEWNRTVDSKEKSPLYVGVLPIGSQGCTLVTGLMVQGPYRGQVVYFDLDYCGRPFFVREQGFLAWYERWLKEAAAGYDVDYFGLHLAGDAKELMERYENSHDPKEKIEIIESYYKFESLSEKLKTYYKKACSQEENMEIRMKLIKMLAHFHTPGLTGEIEKLWKYGAYPEAISIITYEGTWEVKEKWYERVFEKLPELTGNAFQDACYTIRTVKDYPNVHAGRLREALEREDLDRNDRLVLFHSLKELKGKEEVLDYFLEYHRLGAEDPHMLIYAIWAMEGVEDRRLQEFYVKWLDKYRTHENAKWDYRGSQMVLKGGCCMGASRPEGQAVSNLMRQFDNFGLDYRGAWKLLMDDGRWGEWKRQNGFVDLEI